MMGSASRLGLLLTALLSQTALASPTVDVTFHAVVVSAEGHARSSSSGGVGLAVGGGSGSSAISMGLGDCLLLNRTSRGGSNPILPSALDGRLAWIADFEVLEASLALLRVQVDWRRLVHDDEGWAVERSRREVLTFRPGDHGSRDLAPLDLVDETGADCSGRRVMVGVTATLKEAPELAKARFEVDAWWEHADARGGLGTRRSRVEIAQGELTDLLFEGIRWPVPEARDHELIVDILPRMQVRARKDGAIDISLDVRRMVDLVPIGEARSGGIGGHGRKSFLIEDGETIRMELPRYRPGSTWFGIEKTTTSSRSGAAPTKELLGHYKVEMDAGSFLEAHADALVLTVRRLR